ncbi:hypothetical protein J6590_035510 [Homalodisca vitripennis]|nr:hypothetical protein J6590_035510 [Homalodisca vitripennis]
MPSGLVEDAVDVANRLIEFFGSVACEQGPCLSPPQGMPRRRQCSVTSLALAPVVEEVLAKIIQQLSAKKYDLNLSIWLIKNNQSIM